MNKLTKISELVLSMANEEASMQKSKEVTVTHMFISILAICQGFHQKDDTNNRSRFADAVSRNEVDNVYACFKDCRIDPKFSINKLRLKMYRNKGKYVEKLADEALKNACEHIADNKMQLNVFSLVIGILDDPSYVINEHFDEIMVDNDELKQRLNKARETFEKDPNNLENQTQEIVENLSNVEKQKSDNKEATESYLLKYGVDLTRKAELGQLNIIVGRKSEIKETARILLQKKKGNPLLIGEPGVGKTSIVEGLAQYIKADNVSNAIRNLRIIQINITSLVAGSKYRGDFEEKIEGLINEASADRNIILFIDEIHTLMGAGAGQDSSTDAANILKPALSSGDIRCIGATTISEYKKYIEKDGALKRRFQLVTILEPTAESTIIMLEGIKDDLQEYHGVKIMDDVIELVVNLSIAYLPELRLPDKAIEILDRACSEKKLGTITNIKDLENIELVIEKKDIYPIIARRANIPVDSITTDVSEIYRDLPKKLKQYVTGQDEAIDIISKSIQKAKAGFKDTQKPVGVFLFLGNTGTGKTYLAECLAEVLYGSKDKLITFDMSEYKESNTIARLMGSPPGYIGHDEEGLLSRKVGRNPASVVLFDEIEKADASIMDIFLQMFDKGKVTDASGRVITFGQTIIIMTSNLLANNAPINKVIGFDKTLGKISETPLMDNEAIFNNLKNHIRIEILNRIENIIVFNKLSDDALMKIAKNYCAQINTNMEKKNIEVKVDDDILKYVLDQSMTDEYGAREIKRSLDKHIVEILVEYLLNNTTNLNDAKKMLMVIKDNNKLYVKEG